VKTLVVYYSRTGNNEKIAHEIAHALGADVEQVQEQADRTGGGGYMRAAGDAIRRRPAQLEPARSSPEDYDLVILGGPVWAQTMCTPVRTYARQHSTEFNSLALFSVGGAAFFARKAIDSIARATGISPAASLALSESQVEGNHAKEVSDFVASLTTAPSRRRAS